MLLNPSFGISTISPKNSSSFNIFSTSAIAFIKYRNRYHMKNNIKYGHTNNTSVIISFKPKSQKLPAMVLLLGRTSEEVFMMLVVVLHFIFVSSLLIFISFLIFICRCSSFTFHLLFDIIPHPSLDYRRVFTPILHFQPSPSESDSRYFHFQLFRYLLTARATVLSGHFLPTGFFYLTFLHRHFDLRLSRLSLGAGSSSLKFAGLYTDPRNTDPAHLFV